MSASMVFTKMGEGQKMMDADVEVGDPTKQPDNHSDGSDSDVTTVIRGNWGRKLDFLLSCVGYAVGLGNLWRFPYLCMRNGGGAFLIPYFSFLFLCGIPLFFMELSLGQYASLSPMSIWKICPLFKGLGYGMALVSGIVCIYYNLILAWALYYMGMSFTTHQLPWTSCNNPWNTPNCVQRSGLVASAADVNVSVGAANDSLLPAAAGARGRAGSAATEGMSALGTTIASYVQDVSHSNRTPAEEFWHYNVLEISPGIHEMGGIRWQLLLCLIAAWIIVYLCLCKGIKTSGKVVYVTAVAPYIMLLVFLVRGLMLPGAMLGVRYYLMPDWYRLLDFQVWTEACAQIFYSLGPAYGSLITMSSYNKFNSDCYKDALIIPCINCGTSFLAGFAIFSIIGFMADQANVPVDDVITSGPGLAFVVYPEALSQLPISQFWAIIFFLMLFILGLDTQFGMFEVMASGFIDEFHQYLGRHKTSFTILMCVLQFLIGLPLVCRGGIYLFQVMDWYSATFSLITIGCLECIVIAWVYGADRFYGDIEKMIGYRPCIWWKICWKFITPGLLLVVLAVTIARFNNVTYGDYVYPAWATAVGWMFAMVSLLPIPILMIKNICMAEGPLRKRIQLLLRPTADWGPAQTVKLEQLEQRHILVVPEMEQLPEEEEAEDGGEPQKTPLVDQPLVIDADEQMGDIREKPGNGTLPQSETDAAFKEEEGEKEAVSARL